MSRKVNFILLIFIVLILSIMVYPDIISGNYMQDIVLLIIALVFFTFIFTLVWISYKREQKREIKLYIDFLSLYEQINASDFSYADITIKLPLFRIYLPFFAVSDSISSPQNKVCLKLLVNLDDIKENKLFSEEPIILGRIEGVE